MVTYEEYYTNKMNFCFREKSVLPYQSLNETCVYIIMIKVWQLVYFF